MVDRGCGGGGGEGLAWADGRWSAGLSSLQGGGGLPAGHTYRGKPEKGVLVGGSPGHQGPGPQLHRVRCRKALSASTPREMMDSRCLSGLPATLCAHRPVSSSVYRRVYVYAFRELLVSMERKRERCRTYLLLLLVHLLPPSRLPPPNPRAARSNSQLRRVNEDANVANLRFFHYSLSSLFIRLFARLILEFYGKDKKNTVYTVYIYIYIREKLYLISRKERISFIYPFIPFV